MVRSATSAVSGSSTHLVGRLAMISCRVHGFDASQHATFKLPSGDEGETRACTGRVGDNTILSILRKW